MSDAMVKSLPKINGFSLQRPKLFPMLVFIALISGISLFFVWSRIEVVHLEYDISRLEGQMRDIRQENRRLSLEAASLRSPNRIERIALSRLGLKYPSSDQVVTID